MIHQASQGLASLGRNGDSMLVHMSPNEVAGLQGLAMAQGGSLTINPDTGMPEAFSLGGLFSSFLPTIIGSMVAPGFGTTAALMAGAATGAGLAAAKGDNVLMGGLMGGMGGYGGADIGKALAASAGANTGTAAATEALKNTAASTVGGAGNVGMFTAGNMGAPGIGPETIFGQAGEYAAAGAPNLGVTANTPNPFAGAGGYDTAALTNAQNLAISSGAGPGSSFSGSSAFNPMQELKTSAKGIGNLISGQSGAWDAAKAAVPNIGTKLALTGAGGLLGGLEPTDIYGEPIKSGEDKYDPYATLNLGNDTGLRLLAAGGAVSGSGSYAGTLAGGNYNTYGTSDSLNNNSLSKDGFGIGRLDSLANAEAMNTAKTLGYAGGGAIAFADGGYLHGPGDGMSDSIPATIEGEQPARLADGEFVVPADVVSHLGNGSSKAGSQKLYSMLDKVRQARTGHKKQGKQIKATNYLPA